MNFFDSLDRMAQIGAFVLVPVREEPGISLEVLGADRQFYLRHSESHKFGGFHVAEF